MRVPAGHLDHLVHYGGRERRVSTETWTSPILAIGMWLLIGFFLHAFCAFLAWIASRFLVVTHKEVPIRTCRLVRICSLRSTRRLDPNVGVFQ